MACGDKQFFKEFTATLFIAESEVKSTWRVRFPRTVFVPETGVEKTFRKRATTASASSKIASRGPVLSA